ncbi:HAD domain-containing protein [Dactylosporangium sp. NPDC049140]|uniref:HAD domain-containing protein n=1 Tax=Dactylosporangium sp. NPDC049140 TaxID=3155647 RepID=UPI0033D544A9
MTTPPVWLLDVDGVINVRRPQWHAQPHHGTAFSAGMGWRMRWAPQLIARIRALHRTGAAEVRWCTSWCAEADQLERLFRLPAFGRAFPDETPGDGRKLAAARAVLAEGRRLIWTDDAEVPVPQEEPELYSELTAGGHALLIRPHERDGLRPAHLDQIEAFARAPSTA